MIFFSVILNSITHDSPALKSTVQLWFTPWCGTRKSSSILVFPAMLSPIRNIIIRLDIIHCPPSHTQSVSHAISTKTPIHKPSSAGCSLWRFYSPRPFYGCWSSRPADYRPPRHTPQCGPSAPRRPAPPRPARCQRPRGAAWRPITFASTRLYRRVFVCGHTAGKRRNTSLPPAIQSLLMVPPPPPQGKCENAVLSPANPVRVGIRKGFASRGQ